MSKPWDKLRKPVRSPIEPGSWTTHGLTEVRLHLVDYKHKTIRISFGKGDGDGVSLAWQSAREVGEFLIELSKQLEEHSNGS